MLSENSIKELRATLSGAYSSINYQITQLSNQPIDQRVIPTEAARPG